MSFRDSFESQQQNFINERILATINEVLPVYRESEFRDEHDTSLVNGLLIEHLKRTLPAIKESQPHFGEWSTTQWTDESLAPFFRGDAEVPQLQSGVAIRRFRTSVPSSLEDAVSRRYEIKQYPWLRRLNPVDGLTRVSWRRE